MRALLVAGLVVAVCAGLAGATGSAFAQEAGRCTGATEEPPVMQRPSGKLSRLQEKSVQFAFDGNRDKSDRTVGIDASPLLKPGAAVFAELAGDLERADGGDSFPVEAIVVRTLTTRSGTVRLAICLDPDQPENVERGRYVGSVKLSGGQIEPTAITLEATLRLPAAVAVVVLFLGVVLGLVLKALGDKKATEETLRVAGAGSGSDPRFNWRDYLTGGQFVTGVIIGLILAALAYAQIYSSDPDWGTPLDVVTLGLAGVAAVVSGKTAVDVVAPYVPSLPK